MKANSARVDPSCRRYGVQTLTFRHRRLPDLRVNWRLCPEHAQRELLRHAGGDWSCSNRTILAG